jgi:hypothetical protein
MPAWNDVPDEIKKRFPPPPEREKFANQEEYEDALGYWQCHVGRNVGLVMQQHQAAIRDEEFVFTGTLIEGPDIDLVALSGLELSEEDMDRIWDEISPQGLLVDVLNVEEIEAGEIDSIPGMSDSYYEYRCGPKTEFIAKLRSALLQLLEKKS